MDAEKFIDALDDFVDFKIMLGDKGVEHHWQYAKREQIYERLIAAVKAGEGSQPPAGEPA